MKGGWGKGEKQNIIDMSNRNTHLPQPRESAAVCARTAARAWVLTDAVSAEVEVDCIEENV